MNQRTNTWQKGGIALCLSLFLFMGAIAQDFQLRGKITDATAKSPVASATVFNKTSAKGAATDAQGEFSIMAKTGDVLTISFIGYEEQQVKVTGNTYLQIALYAISKDLSDVVVTALGIRKETKRLGYSI